MSILINKDTKVITQGITGKTGQFHTEKCQEYANGKNCFVAGVNPKKAGESIFNIPIYGSVKEAASTTGATVSVIYVPPAGAAAAIWEAVEADLDLAICITEGIPVRDMLEVRNRMAAKEAAGGKKTLLLGPNCPGLITPDEIKIGIMPGNSFYAIDEYEAPWNTGAKRSPPNRVPPIVSTARVITAQLVTAVDLARREGETRSR